MIPSTTRYDKILRKKIKFIMTKENITELGGKIIRRK